MALFVVLLVEHEADAVPSQQGVGQGWYLLNLPTTLRTSYTFLSAFLAKSAQH